MSFDLLTIGDVSIDQYMHVTSAKLSAEGDLCVPLGAKIPIDSYQATIAGNACNNVIACTKLEMKCAIFSEYGQDPNGDKFNQTFDKLNIDKSLTSQDPNNPTNVHAIIVFENDRTIFSHHAERDYSFDKARTWLEENNPKWIYYTSMCPNFHEFQANLANYLKNSEIGVAFNPGSIHMKEGVDALTDILSVTDVLFVNLDEAKRLLKLDPNSNQELEIIHQNLQQLGPKLTVITSGKQGSSAHDGNNFKKMGIYSTNKPLIDKTGAGDAHSAGFLAALHNGKSLEEALLWGTLNSAHVIKKVGSVHGLLNKQKMEELSSSNDVLKSIA